MFRILFMRTLTLMLIIAMTACTAGEELIDADNDGVYADEDCVHPGAPDDCDNLDNDCDGVVDNLISVTWYADTDGEGFGDPDDTFVGGAGLYLEQCEDPGSDWVHTATDCDDEQPLVNPAADEICNSIDDDCDALVDDDDPDLASCP